MYDTIGKIKLPSWESVLYTSKSRRGCRKERQREKERERGERARNRVLSLCECLEMDFLSADTLGALLTLTSPFCKLTSSYPAKSELAS